jgi:hypothetical protein
LHSNYKKTECSPSTVATGQNLHSNVDVRGISTTAFLFGATSAVLEVVWPGSVKQNRAEEKETEDMGEQQESLDEYEEQESTERKEVP